MDWKTLFLAPEGRIGQKDFWLGALILLGAGAVLSWVPFLGQIAMLGLIYCWVCLYSKRLHDAGRSGFLVLIPLLASCAVGVLVIAIMGGAAAIAAMSDGSEEMAVFGGLMGVFALIGLVCLLCLAFLLWVGLSKGQPGENRYGPAPLRSLFDSPRTPPATAV